ncbi:SPOR domain-containing protein [Sinimarinibacterium sp. CAU 1509]|uniref:SPOR domain-containing protein n=1 Tax=Sinimarinibacterium sp. CAU 1509 TaxID=2562283 RepID=UPI0010AD611F|nr:SPOR domain-containing protein [Sinimarinibacterium sp. CAU 1509]TJY55171.1 SPOR domain-containing protein [Sinimarinibacterium sp. CAU 1509]
MSRDYAQRSSPRRQATSRGHAKPKAMPGWVWLLAGLSFGLAIAAFVYISRPAPELARSDEPSPVIAAKKPAAAKNAPIPLPPKEKPRFTFYEILRDQEVVVPKEQTRSAKAPKVDAPTAADSSTEQYVIQVASFREQKEADRQKASLALIGIESRIESVTIDGKDTYYRVRVGPESSWSKVQATVARLDDNGIDAMVIKLK